MSRPTLEHPSIDLELLERLQAREPAAFDLVVRTFRDRIFRFVQRGVGDREAAEDITQDVFVKLYRHAPSLQSASRFLPWMYRTARTTMIDHQRRRARERRVLMDDESLGLYSTEATTPERPLVRQEQAQALQQALSGLAERFRTPFLLREVEGLRYREIARLLGLPEKTISSRISRARRLLAARLGARHDSRGGRS
jgi:RNA polymerase sigma-70 factor (ECF subfamily)